MIKKAFSLVLGACFLISNIGYSYAETPPLEAPSSAQPTQAIPEEWGKITSSFRGSSPQTVFYIQDAHLNPSAQLSIAHLIEHLKIQEGVTALGVEGAGDASNLPDFWSLPFPDVKEKILGELLKGREITGAEYFTYLKGEGVELFSADNSELYLQNIRAYVDSMPWREEVLRDLETLQVNLDNLKSAVFNRSLKAFDSRLKDLLRDQKNYYETLKYLLSTAHEKGISLALYPTLSAYQDISTHKVKAPPVLDPHQMMEEIERLTREIKSGLYQSKDERLLDDLEGKLKLLMNFFRLEMLPEEFRSYKKDPASYRLEDIAKELLPIAKKEHVNFRPLGRPSIDSKQEMQDLEKFYRLAHERDKALVENQLETMKVRNASKGVLVAGGFHGQGIQAELKKRGVSFFVIQPQMTVDPESSKAYQDIFRSYQTLFKSAGSSTVVPLSRMIPLRLPELNTGETVSHFWSEKIYAPYIRAVQTKNLERPYQIALARGGVAGEMSAPALLGSVFDSGFELGRLNSDLRQEKGLTLVSDPSFFEAEKLVRAASLGDKGSVKVMLIYLTDHIHEGKIYEPLGIETLAGYLEKVFSDPKEGIRPEVTLVHSQMEGSIDAIMKRIKEEKPSVVGLSIWFGTLDMAREIYNRIQSEIPEKERPEILLGNTLATYNAERLMAPGFFPSAIVNVKEGEQALAGLIRHIHDPKKHPLKEVPNIIYRARIPGKRRETRATSARMRAVTGETSVVKTPSDIVTTKTAQLDMSTLGLPSRIFADQCIAQGNNVNMEASRGCMSHCSYCSQANTGFRAKPMDALMEEIIDLNNRGAKKINIVDDVFLGGDQKLLNEFADRIMALKKEGKLYEHLLFYTTARARDIWNWKGTPEENLARKATYKKLRLAGFMTFNIGIESGADTQLRRYGKGIPVKVNEEALRVLREIGQETGLPVEAEAGFITFDPETTVDEVVQNLEFLDRTGLKYTISYPAQQLRVQEGTGFVPMARRSGLLHEGEGAYDPNWLVYDYHYRHPEVARIVYHLKRWEPSVFRFFYAFKQLMRAMPVPGTTPEEHAILTREYRRIHEIQVDLMKGLTDAERGIDPKLTPDEARTASLNQMNDQLRRFYYNFLYEIQRKRIWTDKDIFTRLIYLSLVKNFIIYSDKGWDKGEVFSAQDLIDSIKPPDDMKIEIDHPARSFRIVQALTKLEQEGELQSDKKNLFRITGEFFAFKEMQKIDLPKGGKPSSTFEYDPTRGRSINVIFAGVPFSGRATAAKKISEEYKIPRISVKELLTNPPRDVVAEVIRNDKDMENQYELAKRGKGRFPYPLVRELLLRKLKKTDLSRGFVMDAGLYLDRLERDVFRRLGVSIDYVLFLEPDEELRKEYMKNTSSEEVEIGNRRASDHTQDMHNLFLHFYQRGQAIRVPLDKLHANAAEAVFAALYANFSYFLRPEDVSFEKLYPNARNLPPETLKTLKMKAEILSEILVADHAGLKKAFEMFKTCCSMEKAENTVIANPGKRLNGRVSDQTLRLIMIQANLATGTDVIDWVKFIFGIEPVRLALKNGWLPGFTLFLFKASENEAVRKIIRARMGSDWPVPIEIFAPENWTETPQKMPISIVSPRYHREVVRQLTEGMRPKVPLIQSRQPASVNQFANESVMMFKPGVKLSEETMVQILDRLNYFGYEVMEARRVDGPEMKRTGIMHDQYGITSELARLGVKNFTSEDFKQLALVYDKPEFKAYFGAGATELPIYGGYELIDRFGISPDEVTALWSAGYDPDKEESTKPIQRKRKEKPENPPRVLVVDDDAGVGEWMSDVIKSQKMETVTALTGEEGLAKMKEGPFDLVFIDMNLPGMKGDKVAREILKLDRPQIPIVLMSADPTEATRPTARYLTETIEDVMFIDKPFVQADLLGILKKYIPTVTNAEALTTLPIQLPQAPEAPLSESEKLQEFLRAGHFPTFNRRYIDGINRIGIRNYVMPVRHPKVNGGKPFFLVNGHFIHVSRMYEAEDSKTYIFLVRSVETASSPDEIPTNISWKRMRKEFVGETDPQTAKPGTVRNDLFAGILPVDQGKVNLKSNGIHYSESALEGLKEILLWFPGTKLGDTTLGKALMQTGYSREEIEYFLSDPIVKWGDKKQPLFNLMSMMDADNAVAFLSENFPPYYRDPQELPTVSFKEFRRIMEDYDEKKIGVATNLVAPETLEPIDPGTGSKLLTKIADTAPVDRERDYEQGIQLLKDAKIARVLSTAGTGGRFLGYDKPERERIRGMAELVDLPVPSGGSEKLNAFQAQILVASRLRDRLGARIPMWFMTSDLNDEIVRIYLGEEEAFRSLKDDFHFYKSLGIPRLNPNREDMPVVRADDAKRWIDENGGEGGLFKWGPGETSTKTPGHLDVIASLVLNGELKALIRKGIEYVDVADASNLGTLPDPEIYGAARRMFDEDPELGMVPVVAERDVKLRGTVEVLAEPGKKFDFEAVLRGGNPLSSTLPAEWKIGLTPEGEPRLFHQGKEIDPAQVHFTYQASPETGGGILQLNKKVQIVESLRIPPTFNQMVIRDFFTFRSLIKVDAILKFYGLTKEEYLQMNPGELAKRVTEVHQKIPLYVEVKDVPHDVTGQKRKATQFARLYGDLSAFIPTRYLVVDREGKDTLSGYAGYKKPEDTARNQPTAERIIGQLMALTPDRNPKVSPDDLTSAVRGQSLGDQAQSKLRDLVLEGRSRVHSILFVPDEAGLKDLNEELLRSLLRNPNNHLSLYLPEDLIGKVPQKWQRKNLHLVNSGKVPIRQYLDQSRSAYGSTALIAPEDILQGPGLKGFSGYRLVSDRLKDKQGVSDNRSGRYVANFLAGVSFGLLVQGDLYRSQYLTDELLYEPATKTYYVSRNFALGRLLEEWVSAFQGLLAIKKAA